MKKKRNKNKEKENENEKKEKIILNLYFSLFWGCGVTSRVQGHQRGVTSVFYDTRSGCHRRGVGQRL